MDKAVMYRATKCIIYRNKGQVMNMVTANSFFTSRSKAVDELRRYAEEVDEAVETWERFKRGDAFVYRDVFVSLWTYEESEGRFNRTASSPFKEVIDGELVDRSMESEFETL